MAIVRNTILAAVLLFWLQPLCNAQRPSSPMDGSTATAIMPIQYISNSVVDNLGNLFIFQSVYQNAAFSTRVTVVTPAKVTIGPHEYPGSFSSIVAGEQALYAIHTTPTSASTGTSRASLIELVALKIGSTGDLPKTLPSLLLDGYADIKMFPGQTVDLLYLIQKSPAILMTTAIPVTLASFVRLVQFSGSEFADLGKIQLP